MTVISSKVTWATVLIGFSHFSFAQDQSDAAGFIEDGKTKLLSRNFYFNRDFRSDYGPTNLRQEWAQGFLLDYKSGYTEGSVGFGLDAYGMLGIKLDGSRRRSPLNVLPVNSKGEPEDEWSEGGGAVKMRWLETELKYGNLMPLNPVFAMANSRLFPSSAEGFQLLSTDIPRLSIDAGHFTSGNGVNSTNNNGLLSAFYARIDAQRVDYFGGFYKVSDSLKLGAFAANYQDIWSQYFASADYVWAIDSLQSVSLSLAGFHTEDSGKSLAGKIDNNAWSASLAYKRGPHKLTLGRQVVNGNEPYDYLGFGNQPGDAVGFLANKSQNADFNLPNERSWQLRYDLDMVAFGVPGLTLMGRYLTSDGIDGSGYGAGAYSRFKAINDGSRWERDLEVRYVVQSGPAKDLSFRVRQATLRSDAAVQRADLPNLDEVRVIIDYPFSF